MNVKDILYEECCGCTLCASICPRNAIVMIENKEGFCVPRVKMDKCNNCGLCYKACKEKNKNGHKPLTAYGIKHKDKDVLWKSSSGGAARAATISVIKNKGVVYGASYNADFSVGISRAETIDECEKFFGSKYVAISIKDTYRRIFNDLTDGREVLFISTSCYISGLYTYLRIKKCDIANLITADLICHGVPSPVIYKDYISFINKNNDLKSINFRSKHKPWKYGTWSTALTRKNGKEEVNTARSMLFINIFVNNVCLREHCYSCPYADKNRPADFTLSDYWNVEKVHPSFYSRDGVSAVQINTERGMKFWNNVEDIDLIPSSVENVLENNLNSPSIKSNETEIFWKLYEEKGFMSVAKKYGEYNLRGKLKYSWIHDLWIRLRYGNKN